MSTPEPRPPFQFPKSPVILKGPFQVTKEKKIMKLNLMNIAILVGVVLVTLKFRNQLSALVGKVPVIGALVA